MLYQYHNLHVLTHGQLKIPTLHSVHTKTDPNLKVESGVIRAVDSEFSVRPIRGLREYIETLIDVAILHTSHVTALEAERSTGFTPERSRGSSSRSTPELK
jgi:hypothetical protein